MYPDFTTIDLFPITTIEFLRNMVVALVCGITISLVYRNLNKGVQFSPNFMRSLVLLTLITSLVLLVIGNNLARAFGLVGAMSIIRFRTALKNTQDIIFVFFSLAVGMATGVGLNFIAVLGTLFIGGVFIALHKIQHITAVEKEYLLQINYSGEVFDETLFTSLTKKYCSKLKLVNLKALPGGFEQEAYYHFDFKKGKNPAEFIEELKTIEGIFFVNILFDQNDFNAPVEY